MDRRVKVTILGQDYLIGTEAEPQYVQMVARHVNQRCEQAQARLRSSSQATILVLAALNIADDYLRIKKAYDELLAKIEKTQERLAAAVH